MYCMILWLCGVDLAKSMRRKEQRVQAAARECRRSDLHRIEETLLAVAREVPHTDVSCLHITNKASDDPTTILDRKINQIIREILPRNGEGWLSEETTDTLERLRRRRVWIVDPIDGTKEFIEGIPEWAVSIGLVIDNEAVAGGILNPSTGELFLGSIRDGITVLQIKGSGPTTTDYPSCLLVSRREFRENKWASYIASGLRVRPVGSIAYRLARVAAGLDFATCTFEPRSEWDVAAGVALMYANSGRVESDCGQRIEFNKEAPLLKSFFAFAKDCPPDIPRILGRHSGA
jgi:myo-inositol-1(or 4)-monophosphatase